jgi:DNA-binding transcriptional ArsR family regulator
VFGVSELDPVQSQPGARWELYRLLADPVRLALLALVEEEELAVGELADILREGQPKVSRHAAQLRDAGIVTARKQGSWVLLTLAPEATKDAVVLDALAVGRGIAQRDGLLERARAVVRSRDEKSREFFSRTARPSKGSLLPREAAVCLAGLGPLLSRHRLAVDAGTGDGLLLEMLAPLYDEVLAVDRSPERLSLARARVARQSLHNVSFEVGELESSSVREAVTRRTNAGADIVIASRVLHHAAIPKRSVAALAALLRPGGTLLVIDYAPHDESMLSAEEADVWMGFSNEELVDFAECAGLQGAQVREFAPNGLTEGPDSHVPWTLLSATRPLASDQQRGSTS